MSLFSPCEHINEKTMTFVLNNFRCRELNKKYIYIRIQCIQTVIVFYLKSIVIASE